MCRTVQTAWHSVGLEFYFTQNSLAELSCQLGTCSMRRREKGGVVNERLDVYGVQGLKVAGQLMCLFSTIILHNMSPDISIAPSNVAAVSYLL